MQWPCEMDPRGESKKKPEPRENKGFPEVSFLELDPRMDHLGRLIGPLLAVILRSMDVGIPSRITSFEFDNGLDLGGDNRRSPVRHCEDLNPGRFGVSNA